MHAKMYEVRHLWFPNLLQSTFFYQLCRDERKKNKSQNS